MRPTVPSAVSTVSTRVPGVKASSTLFGLVAEQVDLAVGPDPFAVGIEEETGVDRSSPLASKCSRRGGGFVELVGETGESRGRRAVERFRTLTILVEREVADVPYLGQHDEVGIAPRCRFDVPLRCGNVRLAIRPRLELNQR